MKEKEFYARSASLECVDWANPVLVRGLGVVVHVAVVEIQIPSVSGGVLHIAAHCLVLNSI